MTAAPSASQPHDLQLGITVTPAVVSLSDGAEVTISDLVPLTATGRRETALSGLLYCYAGRIDRPDGYLGGYLGQSGDLDGPRAAASLTHWVITQRRILPAGMAILRRDQPYRDDYRRFVEARAIMALSSSLLWMLNTHTSAGQASGRLSRAEVSAGEVLATEIADTISTHLFGGLVNPHPSPAANAREAAVRVVLRATRALDTFEVMRALRAGGLRSKGVSWDFTIRRDLALRERETRGTPRVFSCAHRNRRLFWNPTTLTKAQALRGYDLAHPKEPSWGGAPSDLHRRARPRIRTLVDTGAMPGSAQADTLVREVVTGPWPPLSWLGLVQGGNSAVAGATAADWAS